MTPEQIRELATLGADVKHIVQSLDDLNNRVRELPELMAQFAKSKEVDDLRDKMQDMQRRLHDLERGSPARIWDVAIKGASGVGILWGFVALVRELLQTGGHK